MIAAVAQWSLTQWYYALGILAIVAGGTLFVWRKLVTPLYRYTRERMRRVTEAFDSVQAIRKEVFPNGGGSLRDSVDTTGKLMRQITKHVAMSIAQNRTLCEQSEIAMFEGDDEGALVWANRALRQLTGLRMEQIEGRGWINAVHDDDRRRVENDWMLATANRSPFLSVFRLTHIATGRSAAVQCEAYPVFADGGVGSGWLGQVRIRETIAA